jgi:hypothetical protein
VQEGQVNGQVELVRGRLEGERAEQVLSFWAEHAGLEGLPARERLDDVVCVATDSGGRLVGTSSVVTASVPMIGGQRFWVHRSMLLSEAAGNHDAMVAAAFPALQADFDPEAGDPIGLCLVVADPDEMRRTPQAVSPGTGLMHAGFLEDGAQVRVRYFDEASLGPRAQPLRPIAERSQPPPLEERYRIERLDESAASPDDVLSLWESERAIPAQEAERRIHEVHLIALDESDGVVGVSTAYLRRNRQLGMDLWHARAYVGEGHRQSAIATLLTHDGLKDLERRFVAGQDTRGAGFISEAENELLKRYRNEARWAATDLNYIGQSERGAHVRVHYFPGAEVPYPV